MKTRLLITSALAMLIFACQNPEETANGKPVKLNEVQKTTQFTNFKTAITEINKPRYAPSKDYTQKHGDELSEERKQILLQPAKELILSTGVSEKELNKINTNDILNKAFKIYISQSSHQSIK